MVVKIDDTLKRIEYKSDNGYSGVMYGRSSMSIYGPDGKEVLHTCFRAAETYDELREIVDTMEEFMDVLNKMTGG